MDTLNPRKNPYVGPRAFETGEQLYGRDRDTTNLYYLLLSERIVLLFSPSGAGKSSLVQAGLMPRLTPKFNILPVIRVNLEPPPALLRYEGFNRYVFSALLSMEQNRPEKEQIKQSELAALTLSAYLEKRRADLPPAPPPSDDDEVYKGVLYDALIFDQFEEILTIAPNDYDGKRAFFEQLGEALQDTKRWALFAAREDYIAALDPYLPLLPGRFSARYRLDLLEAANAMQAMQSPAENMGVKFPDEAAKQLVDDLSRVKIQRPDGSTDTEPGRYVEPVQLQVVCYRLWKSLDATATEINPEQVTALGNVDNALAAYYSEQVSQAAELFNTPERDIREWFNTKLITESGIRSQVIRGKTSSGGLRNEIIKQFDNAHIIRTEKRAGATWYELAHDRMIEPVRKSNEAWFQEHLSLLQRQTLLWIQQNYSDGLLLSGKELTIAEEEAHNRKLSSEEEAFLTASQQARLELTKREKRRLRTLQALVIGIAIALVVAVVFAILAQVNAGTAQTNAQAANTSEARAVQQANSARARELAALSASSLNNKQLEVSLLLGVEAARLDPQINGALLSALGAAPDARQSLSGHTKGVLSLAYSKDGKYLVSGGQDSRVIVWDLTSSEGKIRWSLEHQAEVRAVAFSPDGKLVVSGDANNKLIFSDAQSGSPLSLFTIDIGDADGINALAFSPDGSILAIASSKVNNDEAKQRLEPIITLWDVKNKKIFKEIDNFAASGHSSTITSLAFTPGGKRLASGSADSTVIVWDVSNVTAPTLSMRYSGHSSGVTSVAFSPDGRILASGSIDNSIILWDATITNMAAAQPLKIGTLTGHTGAVNSVAFSPNGKQLVSGGADKQVLVWNVDSRQPKDEPFNLHTASVTSVNFNATGDTIASASLDGRVILWDANRLSRLAKLVVNKPFALTRLAYHAAPDTLIYGGAGGSLFVLDQATNQETELTGHTDTITALAFQPDGKHFASASFDNTLRLWDSATHKQVGNSATSTGGIINSLAFDPSGAKLVSGDASGVIIFWEASRIIQSSQIPAHTGAINSLVFSPSGALLASGGADNTIELWDAALHKQLAVLNNLPASINALAFSPDGLTLAAAGSDNLVTLWDVSNPAQPVQRATLTGHTSTVSALAYAPNGEFLVSGSNDGTIILWSSRGEIIGQPLVGHTGKIGVVTFGADSKTLYSVGSDGRVLRWSLDDADWINQACQIAGRNLTQAEWAQYFDDPYRVTCAQWPPAPPMITATPIASTTPEMPTPTLASGTPALTPVDITDVPVQTIIPTPVVIGGADRVAFVRDNNIWLMNIDGNALRQLTDTLNPKQNLQWLAETDQLIYLVDGLVKMLDTKTGTPSTLFALTNEELSDFRVSPDGQHVAIAFENEMFVGSFSENRYRQLTTKSELFEESHCLTSEENPLTDSAIKEFRWSSDGQRLAWLEEVPDPATLDGIRQTIKLYDINTCTLSSSTLLDEFPSASMDLDYYAKDPIIPSFDWDGDNLFVFNTRATADGWGDLYIYNTETHTGSTLNPIGGRCCYRDARWSPDGLYLFFAFQNNDGKEQASTQFYYVPVSSIGTGQEFTPVVLPDFFIVSGEAPQPALHRAPLSAK